jgi:atypical dual specificity phosphatase
VTRLAELDGFSAISDDDDGHQAIALRAAANASLEYQRCTTLGAEDELGLRPWLAAFESVLESSSALVCEPELPVTITPGLLLGDKYSAWDADTLVRLGVTHILNAAGIDARGPVEHAIQGIHYLQLDAEDDVVYPLLDLHLQAAASFIRSALEGGGRCLIHCHAGINRSGALAIAYLMLADGLSLLQASRRVAQARGTIVQNVNFRLQLLRWAWRQGLCRDEELLTASEPASRPAEDSQITSLTDLRPELMHLVLETFTQAHDLACVGMVCTALRALVLESWAATKTANVHTLGLASRVRSRSFLCDSTISGIDRIKLVSGQGDAEPVPRVMAAVLSRLTGLHELHLRGLHGVSDEMVRSTLVPNLSQLRVLDLSETAVATRGVMSLRSLPCLESLNITFCALVSYAAVIVLRETSPRLKQIRRQPPWLDGHFDTPWGETHTYYPCGAFSFNRTTQSKGWVAQIRQHGRSCGIQQSRADDCDAAQAAKGNGSAADCVIITHLEDRLIFLDVHADAHAINGQVGVCLFPHPEGDGRVIVIESTQALEPPGKLPDELLSPSAWPDEGQTERIHDLMISCMRVRPLSEDCQKPPDDLHDELREFCALRGDDGNFVRSYSEQVAFLSCQCQGVDRDDWDMTLREIGSLQPTLCKLVAC